MIRDLFLWSYNHIKESIWFITLLSSFYQLLPFLNVYYFSYLLLLMAPTSGSKSDGFLILISYCQKTPFRARHRLYSLCHVRFARFIIYSTCSGQLWICFWEYVCMYSNQVSADYRCCQWRSFFVNIAQGEKEKE